MTSERKCLRTSREPAIQTNLQPRPARGARPSEIVLRATRPRLANREAADEHVHACRESTSPASDRSESAVPQSGPLWRADDDPECCWRAPREPSLRGGPTRPPAPDSTRG